MEHRIPAPSPTTENRSSVCAYAEGQEASCDNPTRILFASTGATMRHTTKHLQCIVHTPSRRSFGQLADKSNTACISVVVRIEEAFRRRDVAVRVALDVALRICGLSRREGTLSDVNSHDWPTIGRHANASSVLDSTERNASMDDS